jgi:hypothetical protein
MMKNTTVYIVIRTLTLTHYMEDAETWREVDAMPIVEGVFSSYEAANDFVDPLLDDRGEYVEYSIIEREVQ